MTFRFGLTVYRIAAMVADVVTGVTAWAVASVLRYGTPWGPPEPVLRTETEWALAAYLITLPSLLRWFGAYRSDYLRPLRDELWAAVRAIVILGILVFASLAVFKMHHLSRLFLGYLVVAQLLLTVVVRVTLHQLFTWIRQRESARCRILVVGPGKRAKEFVDEVNRHPELGVEIAGYLLESPSKAQTGTKDPTKSPVLGTLEDLRWVLRAQVIDEAVIALPLTKESATEMVISICEQEGKPAHVLLNGLQQRFYHSTLTSVHGVPLLSLASRGHSSTGLAVKRLLDFVLAGSLLIGLSPLLVLAAIAIKMTSPGPVLFRQERVGLNGRPFFMLKFRTMIPEAEALKDALRPMNEAEGPVFKIQDDPRVTRIGRFLRRTNLDELPQVVNVFRGEMSLVGPRPLPTSEARECYEWHKRHSVRPGMTGPWQVGGRHNLRFEEWMDLDLSYIDNWSVWLDLKILLKTVPEVVGLRGA